MSHLGASVLHMRRISPRFNPTHALANTCSITLNTTAAINKDVDRVIVPLQLSQSDAQPRQPALPPFWAERSFKWKSGSPPSFLFSMGDLWELQSV
jgi:hypothetical protein